MLIRSVKAFCIIMIDVAETVDSIQLDTRVQIIAMIVMIAMIMIMVISVIQWFGDVMFTFLVFPLVTFFNICRLVIFVTFLFVFRVFVTLCPLLTFVTAPHLVEAT